MNDCGLEDISAAVGCRFIDVKNNPTTQLICESLSSFRLQAAQEKGYVEVVREMIHEMECSNNQESLDMFKELLETMIQASYPCWGRVFIIVNTIVDLTVQCLRRNRGDLGLEMMEMGVDIMESANICTFIRDAGGWSCAPDYREQTVAPAQGAAGGAGSSISAIAAEAGRAAGAIAGAYAGAAVGAALAGGAQGGAMANQPPQDNLVTMGTSLMQMAGNMASVYNTMTQQ
ncbi:uncharacterized protein [Watersipora subatra]|uniref:uncharacterized protein n=1 Tax=Watersipora subatra TaxID=2589382 RepID=UPI00355C117D